MRKYAAEIELIVPLPVLLDYYRPSCMAARETYRAPSLVSDRAQKNSATPRTPTELRSNVLG